MPRRLNTRIRFTVEQKVFALGAWMETESIAQACHLFEQEYRFLLPRASLGNWNVMYRVRHLVNKPEE